jgi:hypothetical protein
VVFATLIVLLKLLAVAAFFAVALLAIALIVRRIGRRRGRRGLPFWVTTLTARR